MRVESFKKYNKARRRERGVVLIAVLTFIALILPVTLLILDSVRIESLLPVNEAYTRTAGAEAEKGFRDALAEIMGDQDPYMVDVTRDITNPAQTYFINTDPDSSSGRHEFDYLAEPWARHPENDTLYLVERSLENIDHPDNINPGSDPDLHTVPVRWQLMNVPFGMDDFGEYYPIGSDDHPRILLPFEYVGERAITAAQRKAPGYYHDPSELSMLNVSHEGQSASNFSGQDLLNFMWEIPPSDPNYYEDVGSSSLMNPKIQFIPRPASYFRNTSGDPSVDLTAAGLPADENSFTAGFMREDNDATDRLVYDCLYDYAESLGFYNVNQYPLFRPLQQACVESAWANPFFGSTGGAAFANVLVTSNKEYKPAPGSISRYQLGAQEGEAVPGWHMAIVSDESGRFPINMLLSVVYSSHNIEYDDPTEPWVRRDQFDDSNPDDIDNQGRPFGGNTDHPNYAGFLLARDMLISLLMTDQDMARLADSFDANLYRAYKEKATWILRQMLVRRLQLDASTDLNRNGDYSDDETAGERFRFPEMFSNNNSNTLDNPPGIYFIDGSGRMGDGQDLWDGTWRVYTNPKDILTDFKGEDVPPPGSTRPNSQDFEILNQRATVYSMDTEYSADPQHARVSPGPGGSSDARYNIQHMWPDDNINTPLLDESALWDYLLPIIGPARLQSIINWREGLVDLNGDGDLDDEYIEQPVSAQVYDAATNAYIDADDRPVSTLTYRERNHPNFQDAQLAEPYMDPDYLNIRSLGDLITIPMSTSEGLLAYSEAPDETTRPELVMKTRNWGDPDGVPRRLNSRSIYPDFANSGTEIAYDDESDVYRNNILLTNPVLVENDRLHPSWGPGDGLMAYYDGDDIRIHDMATDADSLVLNNANMAPDIDDTTTLAFWGQPNWNNNNLIGDAIFEMGSPDINPNGSFSEIAFSQVDDDSTGTDFQDQQVAYNIAKVDINTGVVDLVTENDPGTYDYAPDFSPDGNTIVFTRSTYDNFVNLILQFLGADVEIPVTTLSVTDRAGSFPLDLLAYWDFGIGLGSGHFIEFNMTGAELWVRMHQPMFPNYSPDGRWVVFMDMILDFRINIVNSNINGDEYDTDICIARADEFYQPWSDVTVLSDPDFDDLYELFPDWGQGSVRLSANTDTQNGSIGGFPIDLSNAQTATTDTTPEDSQFTQTDRQNIARDIGKASLALRRSIGWGADDQNWKLKDLPEVPEHVVDVLEAMADVVCFRDPYVAYDPRYQQGPPTFPPQPVVTPPLQGYAGRININTASRPVLRSLFLLMFQGPGDDVDDDGDPNCPEPRVPSVLGSPYINLLDPNLEDDWTRFMAMMVADRYAYQVCEYRKWVYNSQGELGNTDETVPSNLPLYEQAYQGPPPISHYGNFRANPFYPLIDADQDGTPQELSRTSPDPPFRSVAGLFKVMLYDNDNYSEDWTYEGIGGVGVGPDASDLPEPLDEDGQAAAGATVNALDVWGPIYNASDERICTHPANPLGNETLYGFQASVDNDYAAPNYNNYHEHQSFRLFSADDFRRIAPYITVRTYDYRIESRGVVRVASDARRTDITRDKIWIITTNMEANYATRLDRSLDVTNSFDWSFLAQNQGLGGYDVLYFEDTPQSGLALTRSRFLPD